MDAPPLPHSVRRSAQYRGVCLALGALCVLAVLAGSIGRVGEPAHHRSHVLATATVGYDQLGANARHSLDAVAAERTAVQTSDAHWAATDVTSRHHQQRAVDTVRTRGPPATA
jgi:hypothetical protein